MRGLPGDQGAGPALSAPVERGVGGAPGGEGGHVPAVQLLPGDVQPQQPRVLPDGEDDSCDSLYDSLVTAYLYHRCLFSLPPVLGGLGPHSIAPLITMVVAPNPGRMLPRTRELGA